jgi:uncharacterized protein (UPF0332 family)
MFYGVLALLATDKRETSRHSAVVALFDRDFVRPELLAREFSQWLHDAFALRQEADDAPEPTVTAEQASLMLERAQSFVAAVRPLLEQRLSALGSTEEGA